MVLCALLHKTKPKVIDFASLKPENAIANLQLAIDTAEKFFGLEKYLTPQDIQKLDENSMVVYIGDYYLAFADQAKLELGAKKILKVIRMTKKHDSEKQKYREGVVQLEALRTKFIAFLSDRTIDNTMEGAKRRIDEFYAYKAKDKTAILTLQRDLESTFTTLALSLKNANRPDFSTDTKPSDIEAKMVALEETEQAQKVHLHLELNRQIKLVALNEQHLGRFEKLKGWSDQKLVYLNTKESINSSGEARLHLRLLDAYESENRALMANTVPIMEKIGAQLLQEKYEKSAEIQSREKQVTDAKATRQELCVKKRAILEDALAREEYKEKILLLNRQHVDAHDVTLMWVDEKETYLKRKEVIHSVSEARSQLGLLEGFIKEKDRTADTNVAPLKALGKNVLDAKYESALSTWTFPNPESVRQREQNIDAKWQVLTDLSLQKRKILQDDLAREEFKDKVMLMNQQHIDSHLQMQLWISRKEGYLARKEEIRSVVEAKTQLGLLEAFEKEKRTQTDTGVKPLKALGADIIAQHYKTEYSEWRFETPQEIHDREASVDDKWKVLTELSAKKKAILEDDLAREEFKEQVLMSAKQHQDSHHHLTAWVVQKFGYLQRTEHIDSVTNAREHLSLLDAYEKGRELTSSTSLVLLKKLGADIISQKYQSEYSSYSYERPQDITNREAELEKQFVQLRDLSAAKKKVLEGDLARELEKERLRLEFAHLAAEFSRWTKEVAENVALTHFGFTLDEVVAFEKDLKADDAAILAEGEKRKSEYTAVFEQAKQMGVRENVYTDATLASLDEVMGVLKGQLKQRTDAYQKELKHQQDLDALCLKYASEAEPFSKGVGQNKNRITTSTVAPDVLLAEVQGLLDAPEAQGAKMQAIRALDEQLKAAGITFNKHTTITIQDLTILCEEFQLFLGKKKEELLAQIEWLKLRGLSQEQYNEIDVQFKHFDKDGSGNIDKKELKACLYSLGEEVTKSELEAILKKHGNGTVINLEGFRTFMVATLGDSDTREEILRAFVLINQEKGEEVAIEEKLANALEDEALSYIKQTAPKSGAGYDYKAWTADVFSR
eukprot:TRINITY_DN21_c0_g1_i2.p1 TRINITY_DN21_c0_g1~~TRINITY_DN21_c0_g1_i2.p1  ORF type:complete len:1238 (-),score=389.66 TRINITY_DN21_c0_g1_i2:44-3250(-)